MLTVKFRGQEYEIATTLRVAYLIQGQHNHANYMDVFEKIDKMSVEDQIGFVWAGFVAKNPEQAKFIKRSEFTMEFMDNYNLGELMEMIQQIMEGIMGKKLADKINDDSPATSTEGVAEAPMDTLVDDMFDDGGTEAFPLEPGMESFEEGLK